MKILPWNKEINDVITMANAVVTAEKNKGAPHPFLEILEIPWAFAARALGPYGRILARGRGRPNAARSLQKRPRCNIPQYGCSKLGL